MPKIEIDVDYVQHIVDCVEHEYMDGALFDVAKLLREGLQQKAEACAADEQFKVAFDKVFPHTAQRFNGTLEQVWDAATYRPYVFQLYDAYAAGEYLLEIKLASLAPKLNNEMSVIKFREEPV